MAAVRPERTHNGFDPRQFWAHQSRLPQEVDHAGADCEPADVSPPGHAGRTRCGRRQRALKQLYHKPEPEHQPGRKDDEFQEEEDRDDGQHARMRVEQEVRPHDACDCADEYLCITLYLNGFWKDGIHQCDAYLDVDLYESLTGEPAYSSFDVFMGADDNGKAGVYLIDQSMSPGDYYVVVRHFNHLDLVTAEMVSLSLTGSNPMVDFSDPDQVDHGEDALFFSGGKWTMPAGDAVIDGRANLADYYFLIINWNGTLAECDFDCDGICRLSDYYFLRQTWNMRSYAPEP